VSKEPVRCGRPTTSGRPCRQILNSPWSAACGTHATEDDRALEARLSAEWQRGFQAGGGGRPPAPCAECAARKAAAAEARLRFTQEGKQIVRFGTYSYVWDGDEPLALGDRCLLPGNWLFKEPSEAGVTGFGTDYEGNLSHVLRLISRAGVITG
jgi:hypothetical protein